MKNFIEVHSMDDDVRLININTICEVCNITEENKETIETILDDPAISFMYTIAGAEARSELSKLTNSMQNGSCMITLTIKNSSGKPKMIFTKETYDEIKILIENALA